MRPSRKWLRRPALIASVAAGALLPAFALARPSIQITSDTVVGASIGTMVSQDGSIYTIDSGTLKGINLFESPSAFTLGSGHTAAWTYSAGDQADVAISGGLIVESSDRPNEIAVQGTLALQSQVVDVSKSVTTNALNYVGASNLLKGQCATRESTGGTSELGTTQTGPYAPAPTPPAAPAPGPAAPPATAVCAAWRSPAQPTPGAAAAKRTHAHVKASIPIIPAAWTRSGW